MPEISIAEGVWTFDPLGPTFQQLVPSNSSRLWLTAFKPLGSLGVTLALAQAGPFVIPPNGTAVVTDNWVFSAFFGVTARTYHYNDWGPVVQSQVFVDSQFQEDIHWVEGNTTCDRFTAEKWGPTNHDMYSRKWAVTTGTLGESVLVLSHNVNRVLITAAVISGSAAFVNLDGSNDNSRQFARIGNAILNNWRYSELGPIVHGPMYFKSTVAGPITLQVSETLCM